MLKTITRAGFVAMALAFLAFQVRADTFDWGYTIIFVHGGPNNQNLEIDAEGTMTTTNTEVNGALLITGITGSRTTNWYAPDFLNPPQTDQIVGLVPPGVINGFPLDNLIYPNRSTVLDLSGFAFQLNCQYCGSMGYGGVVQVDGENGNYAENGGTGLGSGGNSSFTLSPVAVPEPAPFALFSLMALAALLCGWHSFSKQRTARP